MSGFIDGLDHVVVLTRDLGVSAASYSALFGRSPAWAHEGDGAASATFTLANTSLELLASTGEGEAGSRVTAALEAHGEGLVSLAFRVADIDAAERRLERRGLSPQPVTTTEQSHDGQRLSWRRTRAMEGTHGIRQFFLQMDGERPPSPATTEAPLTALDHVVVSTPDPDRAAALYGARLGLDMALDRSNPAWGMRLMFFRCGDLIVEIAHPLKAGRGDGPDTFYGLTWRTGNIAAAHARLGEAGFALSPIRTGRKPGTAVFSVKDKTSGVPTLVLGPSQ